MLHFYIPWKHQNTRGFLFSRDIEEENWLKMGPTKSEKSLLFLSLILGLGHSRHLSAQI